MVGRRTDEDAASRSPQVELSEERMRVDTVTEQVGTVKSHKQVDVESVRQMVGRDVEHAEMERTPVGAGDSGLVETLPDGSVSIPVFEEELVISKRMVVRERVVIRKVTITEQQEVVAELRKERLEILTDGAVALLDDNGQPVDDRRPDRG